MHDSKTREGRTLGSNMLGHEAQQAKVLGGVLKIIVHKATRNKGDELFEFGCGHREAT